MNGNWLIFPFFSHSLKRREEEKEKEVAKPVFKKKFGIQMIIIKYLSLPNMDDPSHTKDFKRVSAIALSCNRHKKGKSRGNALDPNRRSSYLVQWFSMTKKVQFNEMVVNYRVIDLDGSI